MPERSFDDFDEHAKDYRSIHTANIKMSGADSYYFAEHKVLQLKDHETNSQLHMLDIGCGDGTVEEFILEHFPLWLVNGVDISKESVKIASDKKLPNSEFAVFDGLQLAFPDHFFDVVFVASVLHHVESRYHASLLAEANRVLKPGGRIYIFEHNPLNPATRYIVRTCEFDKDARLLNSAYCSGLLNRTGFRKVKKKFMLFFPRHKIFARLIKLEDKLGWLPLGGQYMCMGTK